MSKVVNTAAIDAAEKKMIECLNSEATAKAAGFASVVELALAAGKNEGQYQTSCEIVNKKLVPEAKKIFKGYKSTVLWALKNAPLSLKKGVTKGELEKLRKDALAQATDAADGSSPDAPKVSGLVIDAKVLGLDDLSPEVITFAKDYQLLLNNLSSKDERQELLRHTKAAIGMWLKRHMEEKNEETKAKNQAG